MPAFGPVKRKDLVRALRKLGFGGPFSDGRHQFRVKGDRVVRVPNPHGGDVGRDLLSRILDQAGISRSECEKV